MVPGTPAHTDMDEVHKYLEGRSMPVIDGPGIVEPVKMVANPLCPVVHFKTVMVLAEHEYRSDFECRLTTVTRYDDGDSLWTLRGYGMMWYGPSLRAMRAAAVIVRNYSFAGKRSGQLTYARKNRWLVLGVFNTIEVNHEVAFDVREAQTLVESILRITITGVTGPMPIRFTGSSPSHRVEGVLHADGTGEVWER